MPWLSTGSINKSTDGVSAHIELLNANFFPRTARVQVIDRDANAFLFNQLVTVPANTNVPINVSVKGVPFHYEIRVFVFSTRNFIINTFEVNDATFTVGGNKVLHRELVTVFPPFPTITKRIKTWARVGNPKPLTKRIAKKK